MNIVLTGSLGRIGRTLTQNLVKSGHSVTVISSKTERQKDIEALGAKASIGSMQDVDFLTAAFKGADIVYLMIAWDAIGDIFNKQIEFPIEFLNIAHKYKQAIEESGVKKIIQLSSIGAHRNSDIGSLSIYHNVEKIMNQLPSDISIKFMRPVAFYPNIYRFMQTIKSDNAIIQSYGGDIKEPWVSPLDIADAIAEEMDKPFEGRMFRYIASDEASPNEVATILGKAINNDLKWLVIPAEQLLNGAIASGMNEWVAKGFVEMQAAQGSGILYEDFYKNKPTLGKIKLADFAQDFAQVYNQ